MKTTGTGVGGVCGRPKSSDVWNYFTYRIDLKKSECLVTNDGKKCEKLLVGRNPTNLKRHLKACHKKENDAMEEKEKTKVAVAPSIVSKSTKLPAGNKHKYSAQFAEHISRMQALTRFIAKTGVSTSLMSKVGVDQDAKLIAAVEHNRCLYDAGDPDYDNEVMKENVWQMIAKSMDVTVDRAKSRWHSLEALYQKSLNSVNKIHLFGKMSFLRPHLNAETREEPKPIDEQSTISIKTEVISSDEEFADTVEATPSNMGAVGLIMVDPYKKSSVPLVTYENQHDRSPLEDLEMKVEEEIEEDEETDEVEEENYDILEEPHNSTSANSSLCHIPPSDTSFTEAKLQEVSESFAKKRKFTKKLLKSEVPKPDQDLEYFKGFMSMIKELNAKRKRQLFASFAQELFRLLEEQELEESESTET